MLDMEQEAVTILIVMNGPFNFDKPTDFNVAAMVAAQRRRAKRASGADEADLDEENRENFIPSVSRRGKKKRRSN